MADMANGGLREAFTFDDVLLRPGLSEVLPSEVDIRSRITREITLNIPVVASAMDTVTEAAMAIAMAQAGGIGVIHRNMEAEAQAGRCARLKNSNPAWWSIRSPFVPDATLADALALMQRTPHFRHSGGRARHKAAGQARRHPHQPRRALRRPTRARKSPN